MKYLDKLSDTNILLITGAININSFDIPITSLIDKNKRLNDYIYSIEYAIRNYKKITHIVFCENTNFEYDYSFLSNLAKNCNKSLEIISFLGNYAQIQKRGKGFGEGEIIEYAIKKSKFILKSKAFYKLTGRLIIKNMDKIISSVRNDCAFDFYPKDFLDNPKSHIATVFYKVNTNFYNTNLINVYEEVNDINGYYLEHIFYEKLKDFDITSFKILPIISGQRGSTGNLYDLSRKSILRYKFYYLIGIFKIKRNLFENCICKLILFLKI